MYAIANLLSVLISERSSVTVAGSIPLCDNTLLCHQRHVGFLPFLMWQRVATAPSLQENEGLSLAKELKLGKVTSTLKASNHYYLCWGQSCWNLVLLLMFLCLLFLSCSLWLVLSTLCLWLFDSAASWNRIHYIAHRICFSTFRICYLSRIRYVWSAT